MTFSRERTNLTDTPHSSKKTLSHEQGETPRKKVTSILGGLACGLAGATIGMGAALHGAQYETEVANVPAQITTSVSFDRHLKISGEVVDPGVPSTDIGGIEFDDITKLPLGVDIQLQADAELVQLLLRSGSSTQIKEMQTEAATEAGNALEYFNLRALSGGLIGAVGAELVLVTGSRLQRRSAMKPSTKEFLGRTSRTAGAWLATTALVGVGAAHGIDKRDWSNSYHAFGWSAGMLGLPQTQESTAYTGTALEKILGNFEAQHACPESSAPLHPQEGLIVTTYNIKRGEMKGIKQIAKEIQASQSDIVTLQEVTGDALQQLAPELDMKPVHGWTIKSDQLTYGNAILTHLPIVHRQSYQLPSEGVESRRLLVAVVELPSGEEVVVATTHLTNAVPSLFGDAREPLRIQQAEEINRILGYQYYENKPTILTGDMNTAPDSRTYDVLDEAFTSTTSNTPIQNAATHPGTGETVDYIFTRSGRLKETSELHHGSATLGGAKSSDHCSISVAILPT